MSGRVSWSPGVGFCLRLLLLLFLVLPTACILLWGRAENRRRMKTMCGVWKPVLPRGSLRIECGEGVCTARFYSPDGICLRQEKLRGDHSIHIGRGKGRTELWLSADGSALLLIPGNAYRRVAPPDK